MSRSSSGVYTAWSSRTIGDNTSTDHDLGILPKYNYTVSAPPLPCIYILNILATVITLVLQL